ncbi:biopolymer transporter ExbD [Qipengyuania sp. XHP0211]|uniref:ExbD/TolR family protein n=1 Tax=Qipengyuania sp. XHP0211 TaxID=3038079 RepID=UPI00241E726C|nr:biopolymer transporter ExbD [Qipengyuania sp. XHP0211]MDG5752162.1 biopolymer transporter ExbD [Qipengyuania sp. XHP0211]
MSEMNITPLIDVMLVLLIMFIIVIPIATHALAMPLPNGKGIFRTEVINTVHIDARDRLYWNGQSLDRQQLLNQLAGAAALTEQPQIRFDPDPRASYDRSARTIALIKDSGIEKFAFVGNERYRAFGAH